MEKTLTKKEFDRLSENLNQVKYQCKRCGRKNDYNGKIR